MNCEVLVLAVRQSGPYYYSMTFSPEGRDRSHLRLVGQPERARDLPAEIRKTHAYATELLWDEYGNPRSFAESTWTSMRSNPNSNVRVRFQQTQDSYSLLYFTNGNLENAAFEVELLRYLDIPKAERPTRPPGGGEWCVSYGEPMVGMTTGYHFDLSRFTIELERYWGSLPDATRQQFGLE
jgi:hypothetical protein